MMTSVIIPNWNGEDLIEKNFSSWVDLGADEIIVVDDYSTDKSIEKLKVQSEKCKVIENNKNLGFARSVNKGVKAAQGDIIILLNTDVKPDKNLIKAILPHFNDEKVFGVSFAEEKFSWSRGLWKDGFIQHEPGERINNLHETFWISGGSGAFRKSIWDELGGLDEIYAPFYWEDVDLCYRALKRGYKLLWEPRAKVLHKHEGTIGKYFSKSYVNFIQERNQLLLIWKNITSKKMFREHINGLMGRLLRSPGYIKVVLAALTKLSQIKKSRLQEIREAKVTDEEVFAQFKQL
ncbi:glycosyltransferase family 2 protein [Candidatus Microgenomates bacterium]|nr:glycosyltransferase family 2 protein [Candidatus Microgenomates bacterium]